MNGTLYIEPSDASFDYLIVRPHWIEFSFDRKWEFISILNLTLKKSTRKRKEVKEIYKNLKEFECEMKWRGLLRRKPYFKVLPTTLKLEGMLSNFKPNSRLAENLNNDFNLIKLIKSIRPDSVTVTLYLTDESLMYPIGSEEEYFMALANYLNASKIQVSWTIVSFRCLHAGPFHKKNVIGMFDILDKISSHVKQVSSDYFSL